MIDLLNVQPNVVSKNLRNFVIGVYGDPKVGKTTLAAQIPNSLIIATELGFKAIPNIHAVPTLDYPSILTVLNQLKKPEVKEKYEVVIIDTLDALLYIATEHVLNSHGVKELNDIPWGKGHTELESIFKKIFKTIIKEGYGLVVIGHRSQKTDSETEIQYNTLALNNKRVKGYVMGELDVLAAVESSRDPMQSSVMHFRASKEWDAGSRFKNIVPKIDFSYENLVEAIHNAVEQDATTDKKQNYYDQEKKEYTEEEFQSLKQQCEMKAKSIIEQDDSKMNDVLKAIQDTLGKKISESTIKDAALMQVLLDELNLV